jgi:hypothetical protein
MGGKAWGDLGDFNGWLGRDSKGLFGPERARFALDKNFGKSAGTNRSEWRHAGPERAPLRTLARQDPLKSNAANQAPPETMP